MSMKFNVIVKIRLKFPRKILISFDAFFENDLCNDADKFVL